MDGILDLFGMVAHSLNPTEYLEEYLEGCKEHQVFAGNVGASSHVQSFISFTNSKLATPADRAQGLLLLKTFLPQCTDEQFTQYGISWMLQCIKGIEMKTNPESNSTAFHVLKMLLQMAGKFPEMTKNVNNAVIAKFMEQLARTDAKAQAVNAVALQCVAVLMRNYGAPCSNHRDVLERYILQFVDGRVPGDVSLASHCFALLPLVGGSGAAGANHSSRWLEQQRRTCATLQSLRGELYENAAFDVEGHEGEGEGEKLAIEPLTNMNPVVRVYRTAKRFTNLCKFLEAMFTDEFPVAKTVVPQLTLDLVRRGLAVNCSMLVARSSTSDLLALSSVLPRIHVALLQLLTALVLCARTNLYPHARTICKLALDTLIWTRSPPAWATERPFSSVRVAAYRALGTWLVVAKAGSCAELVAEELFSVMADDIRTEKTTVKLNIQPGRKSKKLRKKLAAEASVSTTTAPGGNEAARNKLCNKLANERPCQAALDVLYWLIYGVGVLLKPTLHKAMQEIVLSVVLEVQRSPHDDLPIPYAGGPTRAALYRVLRALVAEPHPAWPAPTQFALEAFAHGQTDKAVAVSQCCIVGLSEVMKLIHPTSQPLGFPVGTEEMLESVSIQETLATWKRRDEISVRLVDRPSASSPRKPTHAPEEPSTLATDKRDGYASDDDDSVMSTTSSFCDLDANTIAALNASVGRIPSQGKTSPRAPPPTPSTPTPSLTSRGNGIKRKAGENGIATIVLKSPPRRRVSVGLMGGSEVSKKLRLGAKHKSVYMIDENNADVVDLSSGNEEDEDEDGISLALSESNISVASSNSNYQDLVLSKSLDTTVASKVAVHTAVKTPERDVIRLSDGAASTPIKAVRTSPSMEAGKSPTKKKSGEDPKVQVVVDDEDDCEIVDDDGMGQNGVAGATNETGASNDKDVAGVTESSKDAEAKVKSPIKNGAEVKETFQGMTEDEAVSLVVGDFMENFFKG